MSIGLQHLPYLTLREPSNLLKSNEFFVRALLSFLSLICLILVLAETQTAACSKSDRRLSDQMTARNNSHSRLGLLKFVILFLSLICLILVLAETQTAACSKSDRRLSDQMTCYKIYTGDLFLLLVNFCHLYVIVLMAVTSLFSITSESLLPKTTFMGQECEIQDYVFHHLAFGLYLIAGVWVLIDSLSDGRTGTIITGSLFALMCSAGHLFHGMYSYTKSLDV
ncbi:unnamed protein product [Oppiella nova]|uniref:Uncharacterized protein n=1 Tax=Oppiella nova TaxID=334625 RepID=A0A7R9LK35_9ACAR|nr:unnamed protein product [Oppiella nova]CAG2164424.1 unnamed protein product [Oppiella nova]